MDIRLIQQNDHHIASLAGDFTFADNARFRHIIDLTEQGEMKTLKLDFGGVTFVDSSALGMLMLLRDRARSNNVGIILSCPRGQVEKMFNLPRFDLLFSVTQE